MIGAKRKHDIGMLKRNKHNVKTLQETANEELAGKAKKEALAGAEKERVKAH